MPIVKKDSVWTLRNRLLALLETQIEEKGHYKTLEQLTEIKATHWRDFAAGKQRPTAEMIESACRLWPQYAFWLATGISDAQHGHIAPMKANFPYDYERCDVPANFFRKAIEFNDACIDVFNDDPDFSDPYIQLRLLLTGTPRFLHQMGIPQHHLQRLLKLRSEVRALRDARELEKEIKLPNPAETWEELENRLPQRMLKLKDTKVLANATLTELEEILKAEQTRLERWKRVSKRLDEI